MRITVEMRDDLYRVLNRIAAERGERGFSTVVNEALETYFEELRLRNDRRFKALDLRGRLSPVGAENLRSATVRIRETWRDRS